MREFAENFETLNETKAKVIVKHILWGEDFYRVDKLQVINDKDCLGIAIHGHKIFMYKKNIISYDIVDNVYAFSDGRLTIIVNKL